MNIIIPMAGLSQRFVNAGFTLPKYMLYAKNKSLFNLAVSSFSSYFATARFIFIARNVFDTCNFIERECALMGIGNYNVIALDQPTMGQADTVFQGLQKSGLSDREPILIFNIDTFRPNYKYPDKLPEWDGYLEVFEGSGANWSYAKTDDLNSTRVIETAEKREISSHCSTGIYYFKRIEFFASAFKQAALDMERKNITELYVAPLYNYLIAKDANIHIHIIERNEVIFCGVPEEYFQYINTTD